jgi:hypothetical protein
MNIDKGVRGIKLVTGEDLLAKTGQTSDNQWILSNPDKQMSGNSHIKVNILSAYYYTAFD